MKTKKLLVSFCLAFATLASTQAQVVYNEDFEKNLLEVYDEPNNFYKVGNLRFPQFEWEGTSWSQEIVTEKPLSGTKSLKITVNNSGSDWWTLQAVNASVPVEAGASYKISFKMSSAVASSLTLNAEVTTEFSQNIALTGGGTVESFSFITEPMTATGDAKFIIAFGKPCVPGAYLLDDLIIEKITNTNESYDWLVAPAIAVQDNIIKVVGPGAESFTKITINGENGTDLTGKTGEIQLKASTEDGGQVIRLKITK